MHCAICHCIHLVLMKTFMPEKLNTGIVVKITCSNLDHFLFNGIQISFCFDRSNFKILKHLKILSNYHFSFGFRYI